VSCRLLLALLCLGAALPALALDEYGYRVISQIPHDRSDFTQGLEIRDGLLYQSTGRYGHSQLQVFELASGKLLQRRALPKELFGEGLTVLEDRVVQLTWLAGRALIWRRDTLELIGEFPLPGEGWGLAHRGEELIYSDGSDYLYVLGTDDWSERRRVQVRMRGRPVRYLNELEWTPDYLLANVLGRDQVLMIDPASGEVTGIIDLAGLLPRRQRRAGTDVLNGIARDPQTGNLWVTGKNWPWIYQIQLVARSVKTLE